MDSIPIPPSPSQQLEDLRRERAAIVKKRDGLTAKIAEMDLDISALDRLISRGLLGDAQVTDDPETVAGASVVTNSGDPDHGHLVRAIKRVIETIEEPFTPATVRAALQEMFPDILSSTTNDAISGTLRRLASGPHAILTSKPGIGKRPPEYRRIVTTVISGAQRDVNDAA